MASKIADAVIEGRAAFTKDTVQAEEQAKIQESTETAAAEVTE
jgi:hypothetical protein